MYHSNTFYIVICLLFLEGQVVSVRSQLIDVFDGPGAEMRGVAVEPAPIVPPELIVESSHFEGDQVNCLSISHDGQLLAAGAGKQVRIWNLKTGRLHAVLRGYQDPSGFSIGTVRQLAFSTTYLLVGVSDNSKLGSTRLYRLNDLSKIHKLLPIHTGCTKQVAFARSGRAIATCGCAGEFHVAEVVDELLRNEKTGTVDIENPQDYFGFPLAYDSDWVLARGTDKELKSQFRVMRVSTGKEVKNRADWPEPLRQLQGLEGMLRDADNRAINRGTNICHDYSAADEWQWVMGGTARQGANATYWVGLWMQQHGPNPVAVYDSHRFHPTVVTMRKIADNGSVLRLVASADALGEIHVWNGTTGAAMWKFAGDKQELHGIDWSDDGHSLFYAPERHLAIEKYHYNDFGPLTRRLFLQPFRSVKEEQPNAKRNDRFPRLLANGEALELFVGGAPPLLQVRRADPARGWGIPVVVDVVRRPPNPRCFRWLSPNEFVAGFAGGGLSQFRLVGDAKARRIIEVRRFLGHRQDVTGIAVSPNGRSLASCSHDGTIRIWSLDAPRVPGDVDFEVDGNKVKSVGKNSLAAQARIADRGLFPNVIDEGDEVIRFGDVSFYERRPLLAAGRFRPGDRVRLQMKRDDRDYDVDVTLAPTYDLGEPMLNAFLTTLSDWVVWTREGYYDASSSSDRFVGWHVNRGRDQPADFYPLRSFSRHFQRPSAIDEVVGKWQAALPQGANASILDYGNFGKIRPPDIRIISPSDGQTVADTKIKVSVQVRHSQLRRLKSVEFRVNGQIEREQNNPSRVEHFGAEVQNDYDAEVDVSSRGASVITVRAVSEEGTFGEAHVSVRVVAPAQPPLPKLRVFAVGVSNHADPKFDAGVRFAATDAEQFGSAWKPQVGRAFASVQVTSLTDGGANAREVLVAMQALQEQVGRDDLVLVLFSGHGMFDARDDWYFACSDFDPKAIAATSITHAYLCNWFDKLPGRAVMFLDTCHAAGAVVPGVAARAHHSQRTNIWGGSGRIVFSSCLPLEQSVEVGENGAFTGVLLETLRDGTADVNLDGWLSATELEARVKDRVPRVTMGRQHPTVEKPSSLHEIHLFKY